MVAVVVAAVLVGLAIPSFRETGIRQKVSAYSNDLIGAIGLARSEAAKRAVPVAVIAQAGSTSTSWGAGGWLVKASTVDAGGNIVFTGNPSVFVVRTHDALDTNYGVTSAPTASPCTGACTTAGQIVFDATGALLGASKVDLNVCRPDHNAQQSMRIQIQSSGIATSFRDTSTSPAPAC